VLNTTAALDILSERVQLAIHRQIAAHFTRSTGANDSGGDGTDTSAGTDGKWRGHQLLESVSKTIFLSTMEAIFGGVKEGFATEDTFRSLQSFDASFPLLIAGMPLALFPVAAKSLAHLHSLFRDPTSYADAACSYVTARDRQVAVASVIVASVLRVIAAATAAAALLFCQQVVVALLHH
jgi:hypothetical protein